MLTVGVSSVGATTPAATGGILTVVVGSDVSAVDSTNPRVTVTTYRDAVRLSDDTDARNLAGCVYITTGNLNDGATTRSVDFSGCGLQIIQPSAYPLWLVQTNGVNVFVVPETDVPGNLTLPGRTYVIANFNG